METSRTSKKTSSARTTAVSTSASAHHSGAHVLEGDRGRTMIHREVVAKIAGLAVREVEGVYRLVSYGAGQAVASLARSITRSDVKDLGIQVEVGQKEAAIDVKIVTEYGYSIPSIAESIRKNLDHRVHEMTGLNVVDINIEVMDLYFPEDEVVDAAGAPTRRVE